MSILVHLYAWQAAIVGNARLGGQDLRALMLDDPTAGTFFPRREDFRGFQVEGGFEPSYYTWLERMRAQGLVALRALHAVDPGDWVLTTPPPPLPRLPELVLVFPGRNVWYRHVHSCPAPDGTGQVEGEGFVEVAETRSAEVMTVDAAERELLAATRDYVGFVDRRARRDDASDVFYAAMGRTALEWLQDSEGSFRERWRGLRDAEQREYRRRTKEWWPEKPYKKTQRPRILESADQSLRRDDFLSVMEAAGLPWRAVRLACAAQGVRPLSLFHERTSEESLPPFVREPDYAAIGERWARAGAQGLNAALNAR
ncbi:hypothetical protein MYSTI_02606 [Myxococcus stipitatus DSM 14675]|uniref:Uncharacterized protein n=1 Tax=Myxococcus stipitatus (strain DSM 14675 / JCM 12634 / Mx s8) TaxID=1278073 RepID=L7U8R1_MYXSD|nr:hypothetical protein [Myxococcus stipitatus]AGC43922.1 hypothetical protein MYSTI_02606 [Myxococcus stipitatus DSM 14675]